MENKLKKLQAIKEQIYEKIDDRESYFSERSDKWLESDKADEYESRTNFLQEALDNLDYAIDSINEYLEA